MMRYADLHCDTLTCGQPQAGFLHTENRQISLDRLVGGGCILQCFAVFSRENTRSFFERALKYIEAFHAAEREIREKGIAPVLTIENGGILEGELTRLDVLISSGVKLFGFTWNGENCLGFPCGDERGLKEFGKTVAEALFSCGIFPDVSHLSDKGVLELAEIAKKRHMPIVATHSLCRSVTPHKRNLDDKEIKAIADSGGVIGVNFVAEFVGNAGLAAHVKRLLNVGGEDVLAIGADFDGTEAPVYKNAEEMPRFFEDMKRAGVTPRQIEKLAFGNVSRLLDGV